MVPCLRGGVLYTKHQSNAKALPGLGICGPKSSRRPQFPLPLSPVNLCFIPSPNRKEMGKEDRKMLGKAGNTLKHKGPWCQCGLLVLHMGIEPPEPQFTHPSALHL